MDISQVASCKIHPAIGIARVGNHPTEFFPGPEVPGRDDAPAGGYKAVDAATGTRKIKRQAARFRVYAYNAAGAVLGELTPADGSVTWRAQLVNAKAEWDLFDGRKGEELPVNGRRPKQRRNDGVHDRQSLIIDGRLQTLPGVNQSVRFAGSFLGHAVELGEMRTTAEGRLLVLGGFGSSATVDGTPISNYANNDGWHDDVSDGPIQAAVILSDGRQMDAEGAWVIVAPPDFAPGIGNVVTLYDAILDVARTRGVFGAPATPSFTNDIFPILNRVLMQPWVNKTALRGHGPGQPGDFSAMWATLADNSAAAQIDRGSVFRRIRNPHLLEKFNDGTATAAERTQALQEAKPTRMPVLSGDSGDATPNVPDTWLTLTKLQYDLLSLWSAGTFLPDWQGVPPMPPAAVTPAGLDRAALENATGGAFFPGIECGWIVRKDIYKSGEVFRLDPAKVSAGDMSKRMAVPWQADFFECNTHWWPSQRPDDVLSEQDFQSILQLDQQIAALPPGSAQRVQLEAQRTALLGNRQPWWPANWPQIDGSTGDAAMVERWFKLGYVVRKASAGGDAYPSTEEIRP